MFEHDGTAFYKDILYKGFVIRGIVILIMFQFVEKQATTLVVAFSASSLIHIK